MKSSFFWSRLQGFYDLSLQKRRELLCDLPVFLQTNDFDALDEGLSKDQANLMSENVIGCFSLPFSIVPNFVINSESLLVPMVTEEPSIVAAASKMAKIISFAGGFTAQGAKPLLKGQLHLYDFLDIDKQKFLFETNKNDLIDLLNSHCPSMVLRGGGVINIDCREIFHEKFGPMLMIEPVVDVRDAMGANIVNTLMEVLAGHAQKIFDAKVGIAILSNYCDERLATSSCKIPVVLLAHDKTKDKGLEIAKRMVMAHAFAEVDIYRAVTHNKGIMNGIDSVALATGNDFRAIESSAHAYAYQQKKSLVLTNFSLDETGEYLNTSIRLPLSVGVVGGSCKYHNGVKFSHKVLGSFAKTSEDLSMVMASVGLAQCMAALFALCTDGIQKGHMKLHLKKIKDL